jgi:calcium-translocating P-type ATPase
MINWYNLDKDAVLEKKGADAKKGLTAKEVGKRREEHGLNEFAKKKKEHLFFQVLRHLKDISVIILLIAAGLSFVFELLQILAVVPAGATTPVPIKTIVILSIVIMNTILAVTQERSAEKALDALALLNSPHCFVVRDGVKQEILTNEVVPGDIVVLKTGDLVPADARVLEAESFAVDEASLTGESEPSAKTSAVFEKEDIPLGDQKNMLFSGCLVVQGHARAVVTETGMNTQIGKIARYLTHTKKNKTPLQTRLDKLGKLISFIAVASALVLLVTGIIIPYANGEGKEIYDWMMLVLMTITLAVAAVPETLMLITTLIMTHGVKNMAAKNALIRKLQAVETLGSTSVICSDKTGTLTQNRMTITRMWLCGEESPVQSAEATEEKHLTFIQKLLLASNVTVEIEEGKEVIIGDPTESAIMRLAVAKGITRSGLDAEYERQAEIPFSSARKMMTTVVRQPSGKYLVLTKGAFDMLPFKNRGDLNFMRGLEDVHDSFAEDALRIIALASKEVDKLPPKDKMGDLEKDLTFEGFIGIIDPPRPEAAAAIARARSAGVRTVMITGDHAATATAIARELGIIAAKEGVITGVELNKMTDEELFASVEFYSVYARVSPEDKIRIVQAWQSKGQVAAMTGDGVNDAPALKAADVGIAMGINGTEVAKSASDMTLTDDNFATIVDAVTEGRNVYSNIRKLIYFLIVCNLSEIVIILFAHLALGVRVLTPLMVLIINVIADGIPGLALAKEKSDPRIMNRKPFERTESFFSGGLMEGVIRQTAVASIVVISAFMIGVYVQIGGIGGGGRGYAPSEAIGRTMAFLTLGWIAVSHVFTARSRSTIFRRGTIKDNPQLFYSAIGMIVFIGLLAAIPGVNTALEMTNMSIFHWLIVAAMSMLPMAFAEYGKFWDNHNQISAEKTRVQQQKIG